MLAEGKPRLAWLNYHCRPCYCVRVNCVVPSVWMAAMMPAGDFPMILAVVGLPCCVAFAWLYVDALHVVMLCSGIACGWWARDRFGAPAATTLATVEAEVVSNASSPSPAGGFAGVYKDPRAQQLWEIKEDACAVIAVRESDGREVRGWFQGSVLTLEFQNNKSFKATLRGSELKWSTQAEPWIKV